MLENIKLPMVITGISVKEQDGMARSVLERGGLIGLLRQLNEEGLTGHHGDS